MMISVYNEHIHLSNSHLSIFHCDNAKSTCRPNKPKEKITPADCDQEMQFIQPYFFLPTFISALSHTQQSEQKG